MRRNSRLSMTSDAQSGCARLTPFTDPRGPPARAAVRDRLLRPGHVVPARTRPSRSCFKDARPHRRAGRRLLRRSPAIPWLIKPLYGLLSDFFPLFGTASASATSCSLVAGRRRRLPRSRRPGHRRVRRRCSCCSPSMGLGLALHRRADRRGHGGERHASTGSPAPSSRCSGRRSTSRPCWSASSAAGWPSGAACAAAFVLAACFPLISLLMAAAFVREPPARRDRAALGETPGRGPGALRRARALARSPASSSSSPSARRSGPRFLYYQTDVLRLQPGVHRRPDALQSFGSVLGALTYGPLSRRLAAAAADQRQHRARARLDARLPVYRGRVRRRSSTSPSAGSTWSRRSRSWTWPRRPCPPHVEGAFFALLMSVYNAGIQGSQWTGGHLYDRSASSGWC